jgi:hypothetical protein
MSRGRPNKYTQIVSDLGGSATVSQIFSYGCKQNMISGTYDSCKTAIYINLRKGNLAKKNDGKIFVTPTHLRPHRQSIGERIEELERQVKFLMDRATKAEQSVAKKQQDVA